MSNHDWTTRCPRCGTEFDTRKELGICPKCNYDTISEYTINKTF